MKRSPPPARKTPLRSKAGLASTSNLKRGTPLKAKRSTGTPTKAERAHISRIKAGACVCCLLNRTKGFRRCDAGGCDAHHTLSGGKRRGHGATLGACTWHHRGQPPEGYSNPDATALVFGPSLHHQRKAFIATYGTDDQLLALQTHLMENPDV